MEYITIREVMNGDAGFLFRLMNDPAYQNRKIGGYVLAHIVDKLRDAGTAALALFTDQDNIRAQACYNTVS